MRALLVAALFLGLTPGCPKPKKTVVPVSLTPPTYSLSTLSAQNAEAYKNLLETLASPCVENGEAYPETLQASVSAKRCPNAVYLSRVAFRLYRDNPDQEAKIAEYMAGFVAALIKNADQEVKINTSKAPMRGNQDAAVQIVEFADFQCPHCAYMHTQLEKLWPQIDQTARFYFKNFPLSMHANAEPAARAALAANEQGKFWEYHDILFKRQDNIEPSRFVDWAEELDLDTDQFSTDYASGALSRQVANDREEAISIGIVSTPALIIDKKPYLDRVNSEAIWDAILFALAQKGVTQMPEAPK